MTRLIQESVPLRPPVLENEGKAAYRQSITAERLSSAMCTAIFSKPQIQGCVLISRKKKKN